MVEENEDDKEINTQKSEQYLEINKVEDDQSVESGSDDEEDDEDDDDDNNQEDISDNETQTPPKVSRNCF